MGDLRLPAAVSPEAQRRVNCDRGTVNYCRCNQIYAQGYRAVTEENHIYFCEQVVEFHVDRSSFNTSLSSTPSLWTQWENEREVRRAVRALAALDDQTLREMGIRDRSQVEFTVRFCRDC
ncbi:hypothetical protein CWO89_02890 [Bradyrhizobium sp. Leo170]|nr:hypothetical protein CWO89_02890 [Bradyrhizobium sp. Leo170]